MKETAWVILQIFGGIIWWLLKAAFFVLVSAAYVVFGVIFSLAGKK